MRAGFAQAEITPPVGVDLAGYVGRLGPSSGIHDPLYARALVVDDGESRAALVVCDLLGLDVAFAARLRREIGVAVGAAPERVMVACTHTHAGPATLFLHQCGDVDSHYVATLPAKLRDAAVSAAAALRPVRVAVGQGTVPAAALNRRGEETPPDTALGVALLVGDDDVPIVTAITYGCHPVTLGADNRRISADYPGVTVRAVAEALGGTAIFLTGASGDVNPTRRGTFDAVDRLGRALADEVVRVAHGLEPQAPSGLTVLREVVALPLMEPPGVPALAELLASYREDLREAETAGKPVRVRVARAMVGWAERLVALAAAGTVPASVEVEIQAIALGPWVLVGVPCEIFSILGSRIKAAGGGRAVFLVGYANGDVGYLPDAAAHATGGYEVVDAYKYYDAPAALAPAAAELVVDAGQRLVRLAVDGVAAT